MIVDNTPAEYQRSEEALARLFELSRDLIATISPEGYLQRFNRSWHKKLQFSSRELASHPLVHFIHPDDVEGVRLQLGNLFARNRSTFFECRCRCQDGSYRWLQWTARPSSERDFAVVVVRDITRQRIVDKSLRLSQALLQSVLDHSPVGVVVLKAVRVEGILVDFRYTLINPAAAAMFAITAEALLGKGMLETFALPQHSGMFERYRQVVENNTPLRLEEATHSAEDDSPEHSSQRWLDIYANKLDDGLTITINDISDRKHHDEAIRRLAYRDELTGLYNQRWLSEHLDAEQGRSLLLPLALLCLDIHDFEAVVQNLGATVADRTLVAVAQRLKRCLREGDVLVRMHKDTFAIVLSATTVSSTHTIIERMQRTLQERFTVEEQAIHLQLHIGGVIVSHSVAASYLLHQATAALEQAKHSQGLCLQHLSDTTAPSKSI